MIVCGHKIKKFVMLCKQKRLFLKRQTVQLNLVVEYVMKNINLDQQDVYKKKHVMV